MGLYRMMFRNRWFAALWAAGVLLAVYRFVPRDEAPATAEEADGEARPANPWALDK